MSELKTKNILFLSSWYPTRTNTHLGVFVFKHARSLVRKGIPITVMMVCEDQSMLKRVELVEGKKEGVEHLIVYYNSPFRWIKVFYKARGYFRGMRHLRKKKGAFDLLHVNVIIDTGFIAWFNYLWRKTPYVITEHSTVYIPTDPFKYPKILKPWIKKVIQKSSYVLPVSNDLSIHMKKVFAKTPFKTIPNVVNTDIFLPPKKRQQRTVKFLHISNFTQQKNIEGLIRGFKKLSGQRMDFTITLAGNGDLKAVKKLAQAIDLSPELIFFQGEMTEQEVAENFHQHDVFVLFSDYENLPCVLVEAQVCGMPIVATDVGGVSEIVNSESSGIIIPARDETALVKSLGLMIDDFDKYDRHKIREEAVRKYSDAAVADAFINVYQEVLNNR